MKVVRVVNSIYRNQLTYIFYRGMHEILWFFVKRRRSTEPTQKGVIITLTSYKIRTKFLIKTLQSLIMQDVGYDLIVVWLAQQDYEEMLSHLEPYGKFKVEVRLAPRDLKSYKKIIFSAGLWKDSLLVTADDDILYRRSWLKELLSEYKPGEKVVLGHRGSLVGILPNGEIADYMDWKKVQKSEFPRSDLFLTSGGGNLYPPGCFSPMFFREDIFMEICPTADDLWQYSQLLLNGYKFKVVSSSSPEIINWRGSQQEALWHTNIKLGQNDVQFRNIRRLFPTVDQYISENG